MRYTPSACRKIWYLGLNAPGSIRSRVPQALHCTANTCRKAALYLEAVLQATISRPRNARSLLLQQPNGQVQGMGGSAYLCISTQQCDSESPGMFSGMSAAHSLMLLLQLLKSDRLLLCHSCKRCLHHVWPFLHIQSPHMAHILKDKEFAI